MRVGVDWTSVQQPTSSATSACVVAADAYVQADYGFSDSSNALITGGSFASQSGAVGLNVPSGGTQKIRSVSQSFGVVYGSSTTVTLTVDLSGVNYVGAGLHATHSASVTLNPRPYQAPAAPSLTVTRISDTQHRLAWSDPSTTSAVVANYNLQFSEDGGPWTTLANPTRSITSWTTRVTSVNHRYRFRVRASNSSGQSAWDTSGSCYTTPTSPIISAHRNGANIVVIVDADRSGYNADWVIDHETDGVWDNTVAITPNAQTSWVDYGPSTSATHRYRMRARTPIGETGRLYSGYAYSLPVTLLSPPAAPIDLAPNGATIDGSVDVVLTWRHVPTDSSVQEAAELRWRPAGGAWTTITIPVAAQSRLISAGTLPVGVVEWQARTKGAHASFGSWSATAVLDVSTPPAATITSPSQGASLGASQIEISLAGSDPEGDDIVAWRLELWRGSAAEVAADTATIVWSATGAGDPGTTPVTPPVQLDNLAAYTIRGWVTDDPGLTSAPDVVEVSTDFTPPPTPTLTALWASEVAGADITVTNPVGDPVAVANLIERSIDGGDTWDVVSPLIPANGQWRDMTPLLSGETLYRVVAVSDLPSTATSVDVATVTGDSDSVWLTAIDDASLVLPLPYNLAISGSHEPRVALHEFAGRDNPVAVRSLDRAPGQQVQVSGHTVSLDQEPLVRALLATDVYYRDPAGRRFRAAIASTPGWDPTYARAAVSLTVTEVEAL